MTHDEDLREQHKWGLCDHECCRTCDGLATTEIVHVSQVRKGDLVTEIDSPEGPFYPVVVSAPGVLIIDAGDGVEVSIPIGLTSGVRRKIG